MLWTSSIALIGLWLLGQVTSYPVGGYVNALLAVAILAVLVRLVQTRRTASAGATARGKI